MLEVKKKDPQKCIRLRITVLFLIIGGELQPEVEAAIKAHWQPQVPEHYEIVVCNTFCLQFTRCLQRYNY